MGTSVWGIAGGVKADDVVFITGRRQTEVWDTGERGIMTNVREKSGPLLVPLCRTHRVESK